MPKACCRRPIGSQAKTRPRRGGAGGREGEDVASAGEAVFREWSNFMQRYMPSISKTNGQAVLGYLVGKLTVEVLKNCGDDLSRENIMRQARLLKGIHA